MNPPSFSSPTERLRTFFSEQHAGRAYTDLEIQQISHLLVHLQESWSRYPRTYIVLRTIGELALLNQLIDLGFTDHWFPVEVRSLPQSLSPSIRSAFVKAQSLVLTKSIDLEKGEHGRHGHFSKDEPLPFEIKGKLGSGGFSQVDRILSLISYKEYALKRTRRRVAFGNDTREAFKRFKAEVEIIKHLKHRHMIEFVGSYTDPVFLGLIMSPVADTDLAKYLKGIASSTSAGLLPVEDITNLRSYFGCLANALQYLHEQSIRHKDIKPQNILIESGNVLFTDFGLSRNFQDTTGSTTSGMTYMTPRYSAPEVAAYDARNTSADIWSLGCVFLEMTLTLKGLNLCYMDEFFERTGTRDPYVNCNPEATAKLIAELSITEPLLDNEPLDWIKSMLIRDRYLRPTAAQVFTSIVDRHNFTGLSTTFCGICCLATDESDSHDSLYEEFNTDSNRTGSSFPAISSHSTEETVQPLDGFTGVILNTLIEAPATKPDDTKPLQSTPLKSENSNINLSPSLRERAEKEARKRAEASRSTPPKSREENINPSHSVAVSSSLAPGHMAVPPPLKEKSPDSPPTTSEVATKRPPIPPQLSADGSGHDQQSDRLREEIVKSASSLNFDPSPQPPEALALPSEFDSYWADFAANMRPPEKSSKNVPVTVAEAMVLSKPRTRTPSPPGGFKSTVVRSTSNASAGADSVRRYGGIRRNVSVSSRASERSPSPATSSSAAPSIPPGLHRSNTVPSRRSPANLTSSRDQQAPVPASVPVQPAASQQPPETDEDFDVTFPTVTVPRKPVKRYQLTDSKREDSAFHDHDFESPNGSQGWGTGSRSRNTDFGRPTTPSWADFLSSGFVEENGKDKNQSQTNMPVVSSASEASDLNVNLIEPKSKKKTNRLLRLFSPKARDEKPKVPRESLSSASVSTQKTPETPRRDLTQWWEGFKRSSDANTPTSGRTAQRVFGVSLNTMIPYANVAISLVDEDGKSYIYGYVPIVVAKCGVFLKEKGTEVEGLFVTPGSPQRIAELKDIFDTPDRYGKGLDWVGYTLHDAAGVFMLFLASLPEPVIPCELYQAFRAVDIYEKEGIAKLVKEYQSLIKLLPPLNRQLLLYLLDCFAVFASKSELNKATSDVLASIFHTSILRRSNDFDHDVNPEFLIFSKETLVFLIENQDHFLIGMESSSDTVEDSGTTTNEVPD